MGSLASKGRTSSSTSSASSEQGPSTAAPGLAKGASRYGNAATQEALAAQEQARLTAKEWSIEDYRPSTGIGMFDLSWNPASGVILVVSRLSFVAEDTRSGEDRWEEAGGGDFDPARGEWQPGEFQAWKADAIAQMEAAWMTDVVFRHTRLPMLTPCRVVVKVEEVPPEDAHFTVVVKKVPEEREMLRDRVDSQAGRVDLYESSADGIEEVDTIASSVAPYQAGHEEIAKQSREPVRFEERSATLGAPDAERLDALSKDLGRPDRPRFPFRLWGFGGPEEGTPKEVDALARRRIDVVSSALRRSSPETPVEAQVMGSREGDQGAQARRVELYPGAVPVSSTTVKHEFGHVLGLPDEYDEDGGDTDRVAGESDLGYPPRAEQIAGRTLVAGRDESIMSVGDEVRPHHYVTILEALESMTLTDSQWTVTR